MAKEPDTNYKRYLTVMTHAIFLGLNRPDRDATLDPRSALFGRRGGEFVERGQTRYPSLFWTGPKIGFHFD
jgi:hypothetical protein